MTYQHVYIYLLLPVGAYMAGSIPFGLILCMLFKGVDIREHGSKNIGASNAGRVCGWQFFAGAFTLDFLKGLLPVLGGVWVINLLCKNDVNIHVNIEAMKIFYGSCAIIGHTFPAYLGFKGGKAVATAFGVFIAIAPIAAALAFAVFAIVVALFRYMSLGSMCGATAAPITYAIEHRYDLREHIPVLAFAIIIAVVVIVRHHTNIRRLFSGTENRVTFGKKKPEKA